MFSLLKFWRVIVMRMNSILLLLLLFATGCVSVSSKNLVKSVKENTVVVFGRANVTYHSESIFSGSSARSKRCDQLLLMSPNQSEMWRKLGGIALPSGFKIVGFDEGGLTPVNFRSDGLYIYTMDEGEVKFGGIKCNNDMLNTSSQVSLGVLKGGHAYYLGDTNFDAKVKLLGAADVTISTVDNFERTYATFLNEVGGIGSLRVEKRLLK
jgi:hypothetical protein